METEGLRLTIRVVTLAIAYLWFGLLYALIRAYTTPIVVGGRFLLRWLLWPIYLSLYVLGYLHGMIEGDNRKQRAVYVVIFSAAFLLGWFIFGGCSLPPSCPYVDVADTVAVMGRNSHGVIDTLGLEITHRRICE